MESTFEALETRRLLSLTRPDVQWGNDGTIPNTTGVFRQIVGVQPDGSAIIEEYDQGDQTIHDLRRLTPAGDIDDSFTPVDDDTFNQEIVDAQGRILAEGGDYSVDDRDNYTLLDSFIERLLPDGTPDASFGTGGKAILPADVSLPDDIGPPDKLAEAPDGGVYFASVDPDFVSQPTPTTSKIYHLTAAGVLDTHFGDGGSVDVSAFTPETAPQLAVDGQGRVLLAGIGPDADATPFIRRYTPDGHADATFDDNGVHVFSTATANSSIYSLTADGADRALIVVSPASDAPYGTPTQDRIYRLTTGGATDTAFAGGHGALVSGAGLIAVDAQNRVWVVGDQLQRLNVNGVVEPDTIDPDAGGGILIPFGNGDPVYTESGRETARGPVTLGRSGTAYVLGSDADDTVRVQTDAAMLEVTVNGQTTDLSATDVTGLNAELNAGDDRLASTADFTGATVTGGDGNDTITTAAGKDSIYGGDGDDVITTGAGADTIDLGLGDNTADIGELDTLTANYSSAQADAGLSVGANRITVRAGDAFSIFLYDVTAPQTITVLSGGGQIRTGSGDDNIDAAGATTAIGINAGDGNNFVATGAGNDDIITGLGRDTIASGAGNDTVQSDFHDDRYGDPGLADRVDAGAGNDSVTTGGGDDTVLGGDGDDTLATGSGQDSVDGGDGNDDIDPGYDADTVDAGAGNDFVHTEHGDFSDDDYREDDSPDRIDLGDGNDHCLDSGGDNTILGGAGDDSIRAGDGDDSIDGGLGRDTIRGGSGDDFLYGGGGRDRIYGQSGHDTLSGGGNNDTLVASDGPSVLIGNRGDDLLVSQNGVIDQLDGGLGNDRALVDADDVLVSIQQVSTDLR